MDRYDRMVLVAGALLVALLALLAVTQGDNQTLGKAGREAARESK